MADRNDTREEDPEDPCSGGRILIPGSHPGYITVEQYERNGARLVANRNLYGGARQKGSAREGKSLLQGIVLCGKCGRPMNVVYCSDGSWTYLCRSSAIRSLCQEVRHRHVEPLVESVVLGTVSRAELGLAVGALEKLAERTQDMVRQWQQRIEGGYSLSRVPAEGPCGCPASGDGRRPPRRPPPPVGDPAYEDREVVACGSHELTYVDQDTFEATF